MTNVKYLVTLIVGSQWQMMVIGMIMMLILAYKNCFGAKSTGQVLYRKGKGFFVFLSVIVGGFHTADLLGEWIKGNLTLIEEDAVENPLTAFFGSILITVLLGFAIGLVYYSVSQMVMLKRSNFIERRNMLSHVRRLSRIQQDQYRYY